MVDQILAIVRRASQDLSLQIEREIYAAHAKSGLSFSEFEHLYTLEYAIPEGFEAITGTSFDLDFDAMTFKLASEFRIRLKTPEELLATKP